jgi:uncharacterized membrane protein
VLRHLHINRPAILGAAAAATVVLAIAIAPKATRTAPGDLATAELAPRAHSIIRERCSSCHAAMPTDDVFTTPPGGVMLDTVEQMQQWASRIKARSIDSHDMPFMNKTNMTDEERAIVAQWIRAGSPAS